MQFALIITAAPSQSQAAASALAFAKAAVQTGHQIYRVFFYYDGVLTADGTSVTPQDEPMLGAEWQQWAEGAGVELSVCIAAALRRGILDPREAERYEKPAGTVLERFEIVGLGQLVDAMLQADRCLTFGP